MLRDRALRCLAFALRNLQLIAYTNPGDPENLLDRFDVAFDRGGDLVRGGRNLTHFQCAGKGAEQSSTDGRDYMVEGGRHLLFWLDSVEFLDASVYAEADRGIETLEKGLTDRPLHPLDA